MAAEKWKAFPHPSKAFVYAGEALKKSWDKLHAGDREPWPKGEDAQEAWRLFHQGKFAEAVALGTKAGGAALTAANKAQAIYANGVEPREERRLALFEEVMKRAEAQAREAPKNANAHYLYAYAAGRYSQRISVAKALAQGYGGRIKAALEAALALQPKHADAHVALGAFHAEIIDKVGAMVGGLTYGAKRDTGEDHFRKAMKLNGDSPITLLEAARGLGMLHGARAKDEARALLERAAALVPRDAMERLDVDAARAALG